MDKGASISTARHVIAITCLLLLFEIAANVSQLVSLALTSINPTLREFLTALVTFALIIAPLVLAETLYPATSRPREYRKGLTFWLLFLVALFAWSKVSVFVLSQLRLQPLLHWRIEDGSNALIMAAGILVSSCAYDFFYYWFHRAQHRFSALWTFHRVHHSIEHLNCVNSYHHISEHVFRLPLITIPLALILKVDVHQMFLLSAFIAAWGHYIHADTSLSLGILGKSLICDNAYHRIHHSTEPRHFDKNFALFPIWDLLFGTYYEPESDLVPRVGLANFPEPKTIGEYVRASSVLLDNRTPEQQRSEIQRAR